MATDITATRDGRWLNEELRRTRVRPVEVARALGVSRGLVNHWLTGRRRMTPQQSHDAATYVAGADRTAKLLTALRTRSLTSPEALAAVPGLRPTDLAALTGPEGPVQWATETRVDPLGRHRTHQVLHRREQVLPGTAQLGAHELRGLQLLTDLSNADVAVRLGITETTVLQWRRGARSIPAGRAEQMLDWLLPAGAAASARLGEAATAAGLSQAQLADAVHVSPGTLSNWVTGSRGRRLPTGQVLSVARALDSAARQRRPSERERARKQLLEALALAGGRGLGKTDLQTAASAGRRGLEGVPEDVRLAVLEQTIAQGLVERVPVMVASKGSGKKPVEHYRLAPTPAETRPPKVVPVTAEELKQRLAANELNANQLAAELHVSPAAVSHWRRSGADVAWAVRIRELLPHTEPVEPVERARRELLAALNRSPGETRHEVYQGAGYGRENATATQALDDLLEHGQAHWVLTPSATGRPSRQLHPGPDPHRPLTGDQLRTARQARGLTLAALADVLKVSAAAVSTWESAGARPVPTARVPALRAALSV